MSGVVQWTNAFRICIGIFVFEHGYHHSPPVHPRDIARLYSWGRTTDSCSSRTWRFPSSEIASPWSPSLFAPRRRPWQRMCRASPRKLNVFEVDAHYGCTACEVCASMSFSMHRRDQTTPTDNQSCKFVEVGHLYIIASQVNCGVSFKYFS